VQVTGLDEQGRVHEFRNPQERMRAIAHDDAQSPLNTLVVSPDNASRIEINRLIHTELQRTGAVSEPEHRQTILTPRNDLGSADRQWAARYGVGDVIRYLHQERDIASTVRDSDKDKVEALDAGADDFVSKPFSTDELMARIRAALRRTGIATDTTPKHISVPNLEIDFDLRRVVAHGTPVRLTPTEFDILRYLVSQANKPVPHRRLLQAIWGPEYGDQIEYLRVFINQLRKKIEPPGAKPTFITTEPRIGYRFVLENARVSSEPVPAQ
jgi:DNA-binding response OmpR family regulator